MLHGTLVELNTAPKVHYMQVGGSLIPDSSKDGNLYYVYLLDPVPQPSSEALILPSSYTHSELLFLI